MVLDLFCMMALMANLYFYGFGEHKPASLAAAILCLFALLWNGRKYD